MFKYVEKQMIQGEIESWNIYIGHDAELIFKDILKAVRQAKKAGWKDIEIHTFHGIILYGKRLESDIEWRSRLLHKIECERKLLEDAATINATRPQKTHEIEIMEAALKRKIK